MKPIGKHLYSRLVILLAVSVVGTACGAAPTPTQPPAQSLSGSNPTYTPALAATQANNTPTMPPSPLSSAQKTQDTEWLMFTNGHGVSFHYPKDWDVLYNEPPIDTPEFVFGVSPPNAFRWVQVIARITPKTEVSTFYHYAGDVFSSPQFGDDKTVWDKQITSRNNLDWHLTIRGYTQFAGRYDGLGYIVQAGGLTEGTIDAVHYDASRELAIQISKEFDRDMLITLHEAGPDAVYPALAPVFEEILQSVTIVDQVAQITVPDAYTGAYHYRITYPTAAWRVEVVEELEGYESPRLKHLAIDGCLLHLRDGPRGTAPDAVVIEQQIAGLTWGVTRGGELYLFYTLYQPDKGISFFIRLELPVEASDEVKAACQAAAEAVLDTFQVLEQVADRKATPTPLPTAEAGDNGRQEVTSPAPLSPLPTPTPTAHLLPITGAAERPATIDWLPYRDPSGVVFEYPAGWFIDRVGDTLELRAPVDEITATTAITGVSIWMRPRPIREWHATYPQRWTGAETPRMTMRGETGYVGAKPRQWLAERLRGWLFVADNFDETHNWKLGPKVIAPRWAVSYYSMQHELEIRLFSNALAVDPIEVWGSDQLTTTLATQYPVFDRIARSVRIDPTPLGAPLPYPPTPAPLPALPAVFTEPTPTPSPAAVSPLATAMPAEVGAADEWRHYVNPRLGLRFDYPAGWEVHENGFCRLVVQPSHEEASGRWYGNGIGIEAMVLPPFYEPSTSYHWQSNEENYRVHWGTTVNIEGAPGVVTVYGGYTTNDPTDGIGSWKSPPEVIAALFYAPARLDVKLYTLFDPQDASFMQTPGLDRVFEQHYPIFWRMLYSLRFLPPGPPVIDPRPASVSEWHTYTFPEGIAIPYPAEWQAVAAPGRADFRAPALQDSYSSDKRVSVSVQPLARAQKAEVNPYESRSVVDGRTHIYWGVPLSQTGIDGLLYVSGDDNFDGRFLCTGQWDSGGSLVALLYSEADELLVTFYSDFDDESTLMAHEQGLAEAVHQRFRVFEYMVHSVQFPPSTAQP